jgi:hypothetical protein
MKSSTLIVSYLWKDTWKRWFEQPSSPLARLFVTGLLVLVATVILIAFHLLERSLRERLERFGLDTVLVRETVLGDSKELVLHGESPDRLAPLSPLGDKLRLRQLFVRAQSEWQNNLLVLSYPPDGLTGLGEYLSPDTPVLCLSETLPDSALFRVTINHQSTLARVRRPQGWIRPLVTEDLVLVPQAMFSEEERLGFVDTTIFHRSPSAPSIQRLVSAIGAMATMERRTPPQIQSALGLIHELEVLKERQLQWRSLLAGILGLTLSLVYGAIAILEFRQNLFVSALLRSFGAPRQFLYWRHLVENGVLANLAALAAVALVAAVHVTLFSTLGFPRAVLDFSAGNPYTSTAVVSILFWVNMGAILSSIPIAIGLRQPVGGILN